MTYWEKLGCIFKAQGQRAWMQSHTAMPMVLPLKDDLYRIYFGTRDAQQSPQVGYVDIDIKNPQDILAISKQPVLCKGAPEHFDDNGVYPGRLLKRGDEIWMYYMGRSNGTPPLYTMAIGLAISKDGGKTFERYQESPILDRNPGDPWMTSTPWVEVTGGQWRMWYLSGLGWKSLEPPKSLYHIKYAESTDGLCWKPLNHVAIPLAEGETNVAAPTIQIESGLYRMWYCRVLEEQGHYTLGYAESSDGTNWQRLDTQPGLSLSDTGWDSQAMAYPCAFRHKNQLYLIYSGNALGKEGIGLARESH